MSLFQKLFGHKVVHKGKKASKTNHPTPIQADYESLFRTQSITGFNVISVCIIAGLLSSFIYSLQATSLAQFVSVAGTAMTVAGAALLVGGLLGFLFGIPKKLQQDSATVLNQQQGSAYQENTNLEQISDWLTKILVGVGLTQLTSIPAALQQYANFTASGLGNFASSKVFAIALLLYFLICGFLITYLWTRLYLAGALTEADQATIQNRLSEVERQAEDNAKALSITTRQLNPTRDSQPITQDQLNAAIESASDAFRDQIFQQVMTVINENWRDISTKPVMERAIPLLRALIANDTEQVKYLYHAYLGFALKEQRQEDWKDADAEFTTAIKMRSSKDYDLWVELQRAEGRIKHDPGFLQGKPSSEDFKSEILADLKLAASNSATKDEIANYDTITKWLDRNNIPLSDLVK